MVPPPTPVWSAASTLAYTGPVPASSVGTAYSATVRPRRQVFAYAGFMYAVLAPILALFSVSSIDGLRALATPVDSFDFFLRTTNATAVASKSSTTPIAATVRPEPFLDDEPLDTLPALRKVELLLVERPGYTIPDSWRAMPNVEVLQAATGLGEFARVTVSSNEIVQRVDAYVSSFESRRQAGDAKGVAYDPLMVTAGLIPPAVTNFLCRHQLLENGGLAAKRKTVAVFGGSFDPITNGHLKMACEVIHTCSREASMRHGKSGSGPPPAASCERCRAISRAVSLTGACLIDQHASASVGLVRPISTSCIMERWTAPKSSVSSGTSISMYGCVTCLEAEAGMGSPDAMCAICKLVYSSATASPLR